MLHYEALQQLTHDRREQYEREAQTERLVRQARTRRQRRKNRQLGLAVWLGQLLAAQRHAAEH